MLTFRFSQACSRKLATNISSVRNHMGHGGSIESIPVAFGPRQPVALGLPAAEATQHILRLLEASTSPYRETLKGIWYDGGYILRRDAAASCWKALRPWENVDGATFPSPCHVLSLSLSDDRTALVKVEFADQKQSVFSLLRTEADENPYYNGWKIVRQLCQADDDDDCDRTTTQGYSSSPLSSIEATLEKYYSVEHGGGEQDAEIASTSLFAETSRASLLTIGIAKPDDPPSKWSAPSGRLLEIDMATYVDGVLSQTPHAKEASQWDAILAVDVLPCQMAATATLRVGNGACTSLFYDFLLLGRNTTKTGAWKIQSKIFSVRQWPSNTME